MFALAELISLVFHQFAIVFASSTGRDSAHYLHAEEQEAREGAPEIRARQEHAQAVSLKLAFQGAARQQFVAARCVAVIRVERRAETVADWVTAAQCQRELSTDTAALGECGAWRRRSSFARTRGLAFCCAGQAFVSLSSASASSASANRLFRRRSRRN